MKVNEIFESIQGEGRYAGYPVLFIRLAGCTRECTFCDTKYHKQWKKMSMLKIVKMIENTKAPIVVWTGGEPVLQMEDIGKVIDMLINRRKVDKELPAMHLETNGDLLMDKAYFDYICYSPKDLVTAKNLTQITKFKDKKTFDIKIVTDLDKVNKNLVEYATMLMPLNTWDVTKDTQIKHKVWNYCIKEGLKFCLRQHVEVWGNAKGK